MAQSFSEYYKQKHMDDTASAAGNGSPMSFSEYYQQKQAQKQRDTAVQMLQSQNNYRQQNADYLDFVSGIDSIGQRVVGNYKTRNADVNNVPTYADVIGAQADDIVAINNALKKGYASRWAYKQNEQGFDEMYGSGASAKYLDSIEKGILYLENLKSGLKSESDYWRKYNDSPEYRSQQYKPEDADAAFANIRSKLGLQPGQSLGSNFNTVRESADINAAYSEMTDAEKRMLAYYADNGGVDKAYEYFRSIRDELNARAGKTVANDIDQLRKQTGKITGLPAKDAQSPVADLLTVGMAAVGGADTFNTGIGNFGAGILGIDENAIVPTPIGAYATQYAKENAGGVGGVALDLASTMGNMAPAIVVSQELSLMGVPPTVSELISSAAMGASAGGNTYAEALKQGYTPEQARAYGIVNGAMEGGLQYLLGGITGLGGKAVKAIGNKAAMKGLGAAVGNLNNAALNATLQLAANGISEGTEEYLQDILDPIVRNITLGEQNEFKLFTEEALYSGIMGALSAGILDGVGTINSVSQARAIGAQHLADGSYNGAVEYALLMDPDSDLYQIAKEIKDGTRKATETNIGDLYEAWNEYIVESRRDIEKNKVSPDQYAAIMNALDNMAGTQPTSANAAFANGTEAAASANINADIYNAVKAVETAENDITRHSEILTRIASGANVSGTQIDEVISAPVRDVTARIIGKDLGNTKAQARAAVREYISSVAKETPAAQQAVPQTYGERVQQAVNESVGEAGQAAYAKYATLAKTDDGINLVRDGFIRAYNLGAKGVEIDAQKFRLSGVPVEVIRDAYVAGLNDSGNAIISQRNEAAQKAVKLREEVAQKAKESVAAAKKNTAIDSDITEAEATSAQTKATATESREFVNEAEGMSLTDKQKASVAALKAIADLGVANVHILSGVNATGGVSVENGFYDGTTDTVYVSINAGAKTVGDVIDTAVLRTASHELTHFIADNTDQYSTLRDFVVREFAAEYGEDGLTERINQYITEYREQLGKELTYDMAEEELVASACETMIKDSKAFARLARANLPLAQRMNLALKDYIAKIKDDIGKGFAGVQAKSVEAQLINRSAKRLEAAQKIWDNALLDAVKNSQRKNQVSNAEVTSATTEVQNDNVMQNLRTMKEDYWEYRQDMRELINKNIITSEEYDTLFTTIDSLMNTVEKNRDILDFGKDMSSDQRPFSTVKPNSDPLYKVSLDFSTLCRKRLLQQAIYGRLQSKLNRSLTSQEQTLIRKELLRLKADGKKIEVACALCYVEAARLKSPNVINDFLANKEKYARDYFAKKNPAWQKEIARRQANWLREQGVSESATKNEMGKKLADQLNKLKPQWQQEYKMTPTEMMAAKRLQNIDSEMLLTPQGLAELKTTDPAVYDIFISRVRTATKSKAQEVDMPFKRGDTYGFIDANGKKTEIITDNLIKQMNAENGLRYQSWSDFQPMHLLDNIAAIMELSTRNAKMQSYTKVPDFVYLNGKTGMMINLSLLAKGTGVDANGNYTFDSVDGMPFETAQKLRDMYPETAGNIVVAVNEQHLLKLLADNDIDYVIPYHLSGLNKDLRRIMDIQAWVDYTKQQSETIIDKSAESDAPSWHEPLKFSDWFDEKAAAEWNAAGKDGREFMQNAAKKYLALCEERGLTPKFAQYADEEGYWKLLIDRKMVNQKTGKVIIQQAVKPIFDSTAIRIANDAVSDTQAIKDFNDVADDVTKRILSGELKISKRLSAEAEALQDSLLTNDNVRAELRNDFGEQLNDWLKNNGKAGGKYNGEYFDLGTTPDIMIKHGAKQLRLVMNEGTLVKVTGLKHDIAIGELAKLPQQLNDPVLLFRGSVSDSFVALTEIQDKEGTDVVVAVHLNRENRRFVVNRIASVYGKNNIQHYVDTQISEGNLLDASIKKAPMWFTNKGLQLPKLVQTIIDANNIISTSSDFVNTQKFELRDTDTSTPREALASALMDIATTNEERVKLKAYKTAAAGLNAKQAELEQVQQRLAQIDKKAQRQEYVDLTIKAKQLTNQLNIWDSRLTNLENTKPIKDMMERQRAAQTDAYRQRLADLRAKNKLTLDEKLKQQRIANEERIQRMRDRRNRQFEIEANRAEILKKLKKMQKKLTTNQPDANIQQEFKAPVAELLVSFENGVFTDNQFRRLQDAYEKLQRNEDFSVLYNEDITEEIKGLKETVNGKRLTELTLEELQAVRKVVDHLYFLQRQAGELFVANKQQSIQTMGENILLQAEQSAKYKPIFVKRDATQIGRAQKSLSDSGERVRGYLEVENTTPTYLFERVGGEMETLYKDLRAGQDKWATEYVTDKDVLDVTRDKYKYSKWNDKHFTLTTQVGRQLPLTVQQALTIWATAKREDTHTGKANIDHLGQGGVVYEKSMTPIESKRGTVVGYQISDTNPTKLTKEDIKAIDEWLPQEAKDYADTLVAYMSTELAKRGNEASRILWGYDSFNEQYYFPINSSKTFMRGTFSEQTERFIKNAGMTKSLTQNANNPIILSDFDAVFGRHTEQMRLFDSMAVPLDNMTRVLNYNVRASKTTDAVSVRNALAEVYGKATVDYIEQFMRDVNGGVVKDPRGGVFSWLISRFKKNKVVASFSVAVQQPSAIIRAMAMIDPKYFAAKPDMSSANWEQLQKYAPVAIVKDLGGFDTGVSAGAIQQMIAYDPQTAGEKFGAFFTDSSYRDNALGALPAFMDKVTWLQIWQACKKETKALHPDLDGAALYTVAGKRFSEVVDHTQVYDSTFARSSMMRSRNDLVKMATAFMAEPTLSYNMLLDARMRVKEPGGKARATRAVGVFVFNTLLNSILKSLVYAARDDDEDKTYLEKYVKELESNFLTDLDPFQLVPILRDLVSIAQGYDIERSDMEMFSEMFKAVQAIGNSKKPVEDKIKLAADAIGIALGIPVKNIRRDGEALYRTVAGLFDGKQTTAAGIKNAAIEGVNDSGQARIVKKIAGAEMPTASRDEMLYQAWYNGSEADKRRYGEGLTEDEIREKLRTQLKGSAEVKAASEARTSGNLDEYKRQVRSLTNKGFEQDDVIRAVNNYETAARKVSKPAEETPAQTSEQSVKMYPKSVLVDSLEQNRGDHVAIAKQMIEEGTPAATIRNYVTGYYKPLYQEAFLKGDSDKMRGIAQKLISFKAVDIHYTDKDLEQWRKTAKQ